jgi:lipopolysaccharide biosynthesis regulator YciM
LRDRGQPQKALSIHQDLSMRVGLDREAQNAVRRALAEDQIALGNADEAIRLLTELADDRDSAVWAFQRLHRLYLEREEFDEAFHVRERLVKLGEPREPRRLALYLIMAGVKASGRGEHRRGRVFLRDALKLDAACHAAYYYMGVFYERDGRLEDAVRAWKNFLSHMPSRAALVFPRLEKALFDLGQYAEIAGVYQQVLGADSTNTDALLGLALFAEKKGDDQKAVEHLQHIIEIDPGHLLARQKLIHLYRQMGRSRDAWLAAEGFFTWLPSVGDSFTCLACGYKSKEPLWFCPKCRRFDTFELGARKQAAEVAPAPALR